MQDFGIALEDEQDIWALEEDSESPGQIKAEEDAFKSKSNLSPVEQQNTAAKIAFIKNPLGIDFENDLENLTVIYENTLSDINNGHLNDIKEDFSLEDNEFGEQALYNTAVELSQVGVDNTELAQTLASYVSSDIRSIKQGIIEDKYHEEMVNRAAAHPENVALYQAIVDTSEKGHAIERFHEINRRYNKFRSLVIEKQKDSEEQNWLVSFSEFIGNLASFKTQHMLMNIAADEDKWFIESLASDQPSDLIANFRYSFDTLSAEEFDDWFEKVAKIADKTSGLVGVNEEAVSTVLSLATEGSTDDVYLQDVFSGLELLEVPVSAFTHQVLKAYEIGRKISSLSKTGNTDLAAALVESTLTAKGTKSDIIQEAAKQDAIDAAMPTGAKAGDEGSVSVTHEVLDRMSFHEKLEEAVKKMLVNGEEKLVTAERYEELIAQLKQEVKDEFGTAFVTDHGFKPRPDGGVDQFEFIIGKIDGKPFADEAAAKGQISRKFGKESADYVPVFDDRTGGWYIKGVRDVQASFVVDQNLANGVGGLIGGLLRSSTAILPEWMAGKAMTAQFNRSKLISAIQPIVRDAIAITKEQKKRLNRVMLKGHLDNKYYSVAEFVAEYSDEKMFNTLPTNEEILAYQAYRKLNDVSWVFGNYDLFINLHTQGYKSGILKSGAVALGINELGPIKRIENISDTSQMVIYDLVKDVKVSGRQSGYNVDDLNKLINVDKTHDLFQVRKGYEDADFILVRKGDIKEQNLHWEVLQKRQGFQREYGGKYFVKQPHVSYVNDKRVIRDAKTYAVGQTKEEAQQYADDLNEALKLYKEAKKTNTAAAKAAVASRLQALGFEGGWDEIDKMVNRNSLNPDYEVTVAFDKEAVIVKDFNPDVDINAVSNKSEMERFLDDRGSLVYSQRGRVIKSANDEGALLVDPTRTTEKVLQKMIGKASVADYRATAINQWVTSYGPYLKEKPGLSREQALMAGLRDSDFKNIPPELRRKALQSALAIRNQLRTNSDYGKLYRGAIRSLYEMTAPKGPKVVSKFIMDKYSRDPVTFLRSVAFDSKLGMFNPDQLLLQINTAASVAAMDPLNAPRLYQDGFHIMLASFSPHKEVHNFISKKFFADPKEAQLMVNLANESGALRVGGELTLLSESSLNFDMPNTVTGAFGWAREKGRIIFYNAEKLNRSIAYAKGWQELRKTKGLDEMASAESKEQLKALTDKYSMSMTQMSQARWQQGFASIPFQFASYPLRVIENIIPESWGGNPHWTNTQKRQLGLGQIALYGAAAVPGGQYLMFEMLDKLGLDPEKDTETYRLALGGIGDAFVAHALGINSTQSSRAAIGKAMEDQWDRATGQDFNATSFLGYLVGASGGIAGQMLGSGVDSLMMMYRAAASDQATVSDYVNIGLEGINQFARENIQTWSRTSQMIWGLNTSLNLSNRSSNAISSVDFMQSVGLGLGLRPFEMTTGLLMDKKSKEYQEFLKDSSDTLKRLHRERTLSLVNDDIEKFDELNRMISILQSGYRDTIDRSRILKKVYRDTGKTFVQSIIDRFNRDFKIPETVQESGDK